VALAAEATVVAVDATELVVVMVVVLVTLAE